MEKIIKKSKTKIDLINIKSKFILKKIFESIQKNKVLNIIKYNKKIQNRLNITQNDYKEFLNIEIEIVPFQDYFVTYNFNFSEPKFYHVYFNDNEKELFPQYKSSFKCEGKIKKVKLIINYEVKSLKGLFKGCRFIKKINFIKFSRKDINDTSEMFYNCSIEELNLSNFKSDNVKDMSKIFAECHELKKIIFSNFKTNNVINMSEMFR